MNSSNWRVGDHVLLKGRRLRLEGYIRSETVRFFESEQQVTMWTFRLKTFGDLTIEEGNPHWSVEIL